MHPSTNYRASATFALLFMGPPLTGKTNWLFEFPDLYVLDCDDKMANAIQRHKNKQFWFDRALVDDKGVPVPPELRWTHCTNCLKAACVDPKIKTIGIDSLTPFADYLIAHILNTGSKLIIGGIKCMEQQHWTPFKMLMTQCLMMLRASGKYIVVNCHEATDKDEITGAMTYKPMISGQLKDIITGMFTDNWHAETKQSFLEGKVVTEYFVRTQPTARIALGNSLGLPIEFKPTADVLAKYLPGNAPSALPIKPTQG
jgi:hypothetical protein